MCLCPFMDQHHCRIVDGARIYAVCGIPMLGADECCQRYNFDRLPFVLTTGLVFFIAQLQLVCKYVTFVIGGGLTSEMKLRIDLIETGYFENQAFVGHP